MRPAKMLILPALFATLLLVGPATAADPRDEARSKLRAGVALMEQGDYAGALAAFEEAYALVPSPKIQFNIGTAYDALARHAAAYEALTQFLADPTDAPAETIAKARATVTALDRKIGRIAVTSDQAGDQVFVDGRPRGTTPLTKPIVVDAGAHAVMLKRGDAQVTENVALGQGEVRTVNARFAPPVAAAPIAGVPLAAPRPSPVAPPPSPAMVTLVETPAPPAPTPQPVHRRAWFWAAIAAGLVAATVVGVVVFSTTEYPRVDKTITVPMP